jgi:hypothetical protein
MTGHALKETTFRVQAGSPPGGSPFRPPGQDPHIHIRIHIHTPTHIDAMHACGRVFA